MAGLSNFLVSVDHLGLLLNPCLELGLNLNRACHSAFFMNINCSQMRLKLPVHGLHSKE